MSAKPKVLSGAVILTAIAIFLTNCGKQAQGNNAVLDGSVETIYVGMGYDTESFLTKEQCVTGTLAIEQQPLSQWSFNKVDNFEAAKLDMGFDISGAFSYGLVTASPKAAYTHKLLDTELTSTYLLSADYMGVAKILKDARMEKDLVAALGTSEGMQKVRDRCGNRYVSQVDVGGKLRVAVKFRFANKETKDGFAFGAGISYGVPLVGAALHLMNEKDKRSSSVEIYIYQEGGNLASLGHIMDPAAAAQCDLNDFARCKDLIESLIAYSTGVFAKDISAGYARIYAYRTQAYYEANFPPLPQDIDAIRTATIVSMEATDKDLLRATYLLKDRESYVLDERKNELEGLKSLITRNLDRLSQNLVACVERPLDKNACKPLDSLVLEKYDQNRLLVGSRKMVGAVLGEDGGIAQDQLCPNFMSGLVGSSGYILDQTGVICNDGTLFPKAGSSHSVDYIRNCPAGSVVTGIMGDLTKFSTKRFIGTFSFQCTNLGDLRSSAAQPTQTWQNVFAGEKDAPFVWTCPKGFAAVGMNIGAGVWIDHLSLVCTNVNPREP